MTELLARLSALFVAPAPVSTGRAAARFAPAPSVVLLCAAADALANGAALALSLARAGRASAGLLCVWRAAGQDTPPWRAPALPAARRLTSALAAHGLEAEAGGRLVRVDLPDDPEAACAAAARATAVALAPAVIAIAGPRSSALDRLLAAQDLIVIAGQPDAGPALGRLACAGVASLPVPVVSCSAAPGPHARVLATAGIATPSGLVSAFAPALEAIR
jgi:hypothetical protein